MVKLFCPGGVDSRCTKTSLTVCTAGEEGTILFSASPNMDRVIVLLVIVGSSVELDTERSPASRLPRSDAISIRPGLMMVF